ncbi:hypothetical protein G6F35_018489 [Rhizopus arrhizus]|nr:hypothetical protein G6F35_018489 [Rhizopus arrhizus]
MSYWHSLLHRALPAGGSGGDRGGGEPGPAAAGPAVELGAAPLLGAGRLRRARRDLRADRGARGARGEQGAGDRLPVPRLAALAVPGGADERFPCAGAGLSAERGR